MKDSVKELWKMAGVWVVTLIWDIAMVFTARMFIYEYNYSDFKHIALNGVAVFVFAFLTVIWNYVTIDCTIQAIKYYKKQKKEEEDGTL